MSLLFDIQQKEAGDSMDLLPAISYRKYCTPSGKDAAVFLVENKSGRKTSEFNELKFFASSHGLDLPQRLDGPPSTLHPDSILQVPPGISMSIDGVITGTPFGVGEIGSVRHYAFCIACVGKRIGESTPELLTYRWFQMSVRHIGHIGFDGEVTTREYLPEGVEGLDYLTKNQLQPHWFDARVSPTELYAGQYSLEILTSPPPELSPLEASRPSPSAKYKNSKNLPSGISLSKGKLIGVPTATSTTMHAFLVVARFNKSPPDTAIFAASWFELLVWSSTDGFEIKNLPSIKIISKTFGDDLIIGIRSKSAKDDLAIGPIKYPKSGLIGDGYEPYEFFFEFEGYDSVEYLAGRFPIGLLFAQAGKTKNESIKSLAGWPSDWALDSRLDSKFNSAALWAAPCFFDMSPGKYRFSAVAKQSGTARTAWYIFDLEVRALESDGKPIDITVSLGGYFRRELKFSGWTPPYKLRTALTGDPRDWIEFDPIDDSCTIFGSAKINTQRDIEQGEISGRSWVFPFWVVDSNNVAARLNARIRTKSGITFEPRPLPMGVTGLKYLPTRMNVGIPYQGTSDIEETLFVDIDTYAVTRINDRNYRIPEGFHIDNGGRVAGGKPISAGHFKFFAFGAGTLKKSIDGSKRIEGSNLVEVEIVDQSSLIKNRVTEISQNAHAEIRPPDETLEFQSARVIAGEFPPGLTMHKDYKIVGTPIASGEYIFATEASYRKGSHGEEKKERYLDSIIVNKKDSLNPGVIGFHIFIYAGEHRVVDNLSRFFDFGGDSISEISLTPESKSVVGSHNFISNIEITTEQNGEFAINITASRLAHGACPIAYVVTTKNLTGGIKNYNGIIYLSVIREDGPLPNHGQSSLPAHIQPAIFELRPNSLIFPLGNLMLDLNATRDLIISSSNVPRDGALPTGCNLHNGILSGSPTVAGIFSFGLDAQKIGASGRPGIFYFFVTVIPPLEIYPLTLPGGATKGGDFSVDLSVNEAGAPTIFKQVGGTFPDGIQMDTNGRISGCPKSSGKYSFTVEATRGGTKGEREYNLHVADAPKAHTFEHVETFSDLIYHDSDIGRLAVGGPFREGKIISVTNKDRFCADSGFEILDGKLAFYFKGKPNASGRCIVEYQIKNNVAWSDTASISIFLP